MEQALGRSSQKNPPVTLAAYAVGFSLLHAIANVEGWYYAYWWIDILMHLGGGAWVAWMAFAYRDRVRGYGQLPPLVQAFGILCFVALVGVLWEFWEGFLDAFRLWNNGMPVLSLPRAFAFPPYDLRFDTLKDLFDDLVGGTIAAGILLLTGRRKTR